jgi:hypothetical protein
MAEAAGEDGSAATGQRFAGRGAAMMQKQWRDMVEAVRRSDDNAV